MLSRSILLLALAISPLSHAAVTNLSCVQTAPTEYKLSFQLTGDTHEVEIFASNDATGAKITQPILQTSSTEVTVHAGSPGERMYFFLKPDHGQEREVSIRHLSLQGTPNFRDLGGYETTDGHFVRWGLIYRSGVLTYLTDSDLTYLATLNVKVVCDFRTPQENSTAPEKWTSDASVQHLSVPIGTGSRDKPTVSLQTLLADHPSTEELRGRLEKSYQQMVLDAAPQYATVFRQLSDDHLPLLYHCTAGKDRTGIFSALLLIALGVPETTVLVDYELTNQYLGANQAQQATIAKASPEMASLTPEQKRVLMAADPAYLQSALAAIHLKYGDFDNYRRTALGVSDAEMKQIKTRLLTR